MDLREKLDEVFSIFIRRRWANWLGEVLCYTCSARGRWQDFDCGHFIPRQHDATRWDVNNARPQCRDCNRHRNGQVVIFEEELREELGDALVDKMLAKKTQILKLDDVWYKWGIEKFEGFIKKLS